MQETRMMLDGRRSVAILPAAIAVASLAAFSGSGAVFAKTRTARAPRTAALNATWGTARELPGTAALNRGGRSQTNSVSCGSPGNCSAGGWYTDRARRTQAFVVSEVKGTWHTAVEVPGTAALNKGAHAQVDSVSCASAGNCSAGGLYGNRGTQAFIVSEVNGTWHKAIEVPGTSALNSGGYAGLTSVSCSSPGNCTSGGYYLRSSTSYQPFVVSEVGGT
jgi:hypothetical protein